MTIIWSTISTRINVVGFVHPLILSNKLRKLQVLLFTVGRSRGFEFYPKNGWVNFGTIPGTMKPTHILRMTLPTVSGSLVLFTRNLRNISRVISLLWWTDLICLRSYKSGRDLRGSPPLFFCSSFWLKLSIDDFCGAPSTGRCFFMFVNQWGSILCE